METKNNTNVILNIVFGAIGLVGIITFFDKTYVQSHPFIFGFILLFLLLSIIAIVKFHLYERKQNDYKKLYGFERIKNRIIKLSKDKNFPNITLYGSFNKEIIKEIYNSSKANDNDLSTSVTLISTGYQKTMPPELLKNIFDKESTLPDNDFSHKFYGFEQTVNVFKAENEERTKRILILFWQKSYDDIIGVEIRNNAFDFYLNNIRERSFSMNISEGQKSEIEDTLNQITKLWEPLKNGFFKPIIPPIDNPKVREEWRNAILSNFNDFALSLIKSNNYNKMKITWNLTENSLNDYLYFKEWIENQFKVVQEALTDPNTNFEVNRYLLINSNKYKNDSSYKEIISDIYNILYDLNRTYNTSAQYHIKVVKTNNLSEILKKDYAYLYGKEEIIQSSEIDSNATPEVLKVYFSKNKDIVAKIKNKFDELESKTNIIFNDLNEFEQSLSV